MDFERYEIGRRLGTGGMGEVHEAFAVGPSGFRRRVAVKRLHTARATDPAVLRMFLDEARIAASLHHGGIVAILDYGVVGALPFQVLEYVDGPTAGAATALGRELGEVVPTEVALHVAVEVAHALHYAHEAKDERGRSLEVVHRDVKPSNVLLSRSGDVKVCDFGVASAADRIARTTGEVAKGTAGYMAPEQMLGLPVDRRADVFALGCTLHALLTGRSPMATEEAQARVLRGEAVPLDPALPEDIRAIVASATQRAFEERYATARAFAQAIGAALARRARRDPRALLVEWLRLVLSRHEAMDASDPRTETATAAPRPAARAPGEDAPGAGALAAGTTLVLSTEREGARVFDVGEETAHRPVPAGPPRPPRPSAAPTRGGTSLRSRTVVFVLGAGGVLLLVLGVALGWALARRSGAAPQEARAPATSAELHPATVSAPPSPWSEGGSVAGDEAAADAAAPSPSSRQRQVTVSSPLVPPPVENGCVCVPDTWPTTSLCHPEQIHAPRCRCHLGTRSCWVPFPRTPVPHGGTACPEPRRELPTSSREGDACVAYVVRSYVSGGAESEGAEGSPVEGVLDACQRCAPGRVWRGREGAPCEGIRSGTGERARGKIRCGR